MNLPGSWTSLEMIPKSSSDTIFRTRYEKEQREREDDDERITDDFNRKKDTKDSNNNNNKTETNQIKSKRQPIGNGRTK
jgi:hypothetical protein